MASKGNKQELEVEFDATGWFDASAGEIKDPARALEALRASRTERLIEVEVLQARGDPETPRFVPGLGYGPGEPDLSDEQSAAAAAYRRLEREILDRIAAEHLREQREAVGLLTAPPA